MIDTDNVKGRYCSKQEMIFYLNAVEEVKRLREGYKKIARDYDLNAIVSQGRLRMRPLLDVDNGHGVKITFHQKACLRIMELFEND